MKKLMTILSAICVIAIAGSAFAQDQYDAGISFTNDGLTPEGTITGFVPFDLFIVGHDLDGQVKGYEGEMTLDPAITILGAVFTGPAPVNVGTNTNFVVGAGGCVNGMGAFTIVAYNMGWFAGPVANADLLFCLGASTPSSFTPPVPGYLQCDSTLIPFGVANNGGGVYPNGCAVGNPSTPGSVVGTTDASWGSVKSQF